MPCIAYNYLLKFIHVFSFVAFVTMKGTRRKSLCSVVFLLGSGCFYHCLFCQNVRFRPLCLPYSSVVPALMGFIRFSRGGFTVLPGWGRLLLSFAVCGVRVCAGGPPACQVTVLLGALWLFKMCPVFLSDKSGLRF